MKTNVKYIATLSFFIIFTLSESCKAEEIHKEWYKCQRDDQCVIVSATCGVEWAANKDFAEKTRENRVPDDCLKPIEEHPTNTVAKCENDKCVLFPRGTYGGGQPIP